MSKYQREPSTQSSTGFGFKSRFSLASLLPSRHPPLVISHPAPPLPTRTVHHTRPVLRVSDRIESSYGLTDDPFDADADEYAGFGDHKRGGQNHKKRQSGISVNGGRLAIPPKASIPKRRPPPLNLARTKAAFPTVKGVTLVRDPMNPSPTSSSSPSPPSSIEEIKIIESIPKRNESLPVVRGSEDLKKAASKAGRMFKSSEKKVPRPQLAAHDSYDFVTLEPEHKYPSWKGGKVDIRPGEHIPHNLLHSNSKGAKRKATATHLAKPELTRKASSIYSPADSPSDQYESVLHNVLLTPTYNAPSTAHKSTTDLMGRSEKRQTIMGRASGWGKSVLKTVPAVVQYGRAVRGGTSRPEEKEMTRFPPLRVQRADSTARSRAGAVVTATPPRAAGGRERAISTSSSISTPGSAIRGVQGTPYRRSPAWTSGRDREESVGFEREEKRSRTTETGEGGKRPLVGFNVSWQAGDGKRSVSVSEAWREKKQKEQALKRKKLLWRCGLALLFIILASIAIGVSVSQLTKRDPSPASTTSDSDAETSPSIDEVPPSATTPTLPAPTATDAPVNLRKCIEQYGQASSNPTSYPCSECVPLLVSTINDFEAPLVAGNSTNVGAALQFCALMDIFRSAPGLEGQGWAANGGVCGWQGVTCDDRGRVTQLMLEYPNVPSTLSDTLGNIVSLSSLKVLGNHTVPSGEIPGRLFQLRNLTELNLEFTALTGPLPSNLDGVPQLRSLTLVNNQQLGPSVPDMRDNGALQTMVITGQGLKDTDFDTFPPSLTYLDLSFNNFEGTVPSLIQTTSLQTLYMTNNNFASPPNSLPSSLQTLSLTSNPALKGSMPSTLCSNSNFRSCDLRNTDLGGIAGGTTVITSSGSNSTSASSSMSMISAVGGGAGRTCGPCRFT